MNSETRSDLQSQLRNAEVTPTEAWFLVFAAAEESVFTSRIYYGRQAASQYLGELFESVERRAGSGSVAFIISFVLDEAASRMSARGEPHDFATTSGINSVHAHLANVFADYSSS